MSDQRIQILEESEQTIGRLTDLSLFFEEPAIMKINLQTQVIHKLFEENEDIDSSKLELFHIQFTTTLIDLLDKIKRKNERQVGMYENERELNTEMMEKLRLSIAQEGGFDSDKQKQATRISHAVYSLHKALSSQSAEYPFKDNLNAFSLKFYKDYYHEVDAQLLDQLTTINHADVYRNSFGSISKQLINPLVKHLYKLEFVAGIKVANTLIEAYRIGNEEQYMQFIPAKNAFATCNINLLPYKQWEAESSKKERSIRELLQKNLELERAIKTEHKHIGTDIIGLLNDNYQKITEVDFLEDLENIDIQANILKTMLETKMI
ncbi:MAG: hypothetical protein RL662_1014 [Bacteroidota bacterium]|jgi:hypothetical protein